MAARLTAYLVVGIVAATFIAGLIVGAQRDDYEGPVDLIVHNAQVFTADEGSTTAEAVAIRGNQILRVGSNREIGRLRRPQTTMIDAGGATVLPGFNDTNVRLVDGGLSLLKESREQAPVTGELPEVTSHPEVTSRDERLDAIRAAIAEAHRLGITSVHDVGATPADIAMYDELRRAGDLALRVYAALELEAPYDEGLLTRLASIWKDFSDDPKFKTGAVLLDLERDSESIAGRQKVVDAEPEPLFSPDELNRFVRLLDRQGWQILAEADTDRAVRMALDAFRHAERSNPAPERPRRHRIERASTAADDDLPRFPGLGVIASIQPLEPPRPAAAVKARAVSTAPIEPAPGAETGFREALELVEAAVVFGSGWPAAPLAPLANLHTALSRPGDGPDADPDETAPIARGKLEAAVTAYTSGGAYASYDEQRKGSISPGMLADLVVLTDDIFKASAARLGATEVAITIFDGRVVYRRDVRGTN